MLKVMGQDFPDVWIECALRVVVEGTSEEDRVSTLASAKDRVMSLLKVPLASGSAPAQFVKGMLLYIFDCDSGAQEDFLDAAMWIRKAVKQKLKVRCQLQFTCPVVLKQPVSTLEARK
jgi:hypothetical protein